MGDLNEKTEAGQARVEPRHSGSRMRRHGGGDRASPETGEPGVLQALRDSEAKLSAILNSTLNGIITIDESGRIASFNPAASSIFGYSPDEVIGKNVNALMPEPDASRHDGYIRRYLETGEKRIIGIGREVVGRRKDGSLFPMRLGISEGAANGKRFFTGIVTDISELKRVEVEARAMREDYRRLMEDAVFGVFQVAADGKVINANSTLALMFGYDSAEDFKSGVPNITEAYIEPERREELLRLLEEKDAVHGFQAQVRRKDSSAMWVSMTARAVRDAQGAIVRLEGAIENITERVIASDLRRARERQQGAVSELGLQALAGADLSSLMDRAAKLLAETLGVEFCKVLELLPDGEALLLRAGVGWKEGRVGRSLEGARFESQGGYSLLIAGPLIVEDLETEQRFRVSPLLKEHQVRSGISVIIQGAGRPFGILGAHTASRRSFSRDDINFVQSLANVLAMAIERKQAEEEKARLLARVEEQRQRLDSIIATIPGIVWEFKGDPGESISGVNFVSDYISVMLGYSPQEVEAESFWSSVIHPDDISRVKENFRKVFRSGEGASTEFRFIAKDGQPVWVEARMLPVSHESGRVVEVGGVSMDIGERKRAEEGVGQALRAERVAREEAERAQERLRLLVEASALLAAALPDQPLPLENVARLVVPYLADWCLIDLLADDINLQRVAVVHTDPKMVKFAQEINKRYPIDRSDDYGVAKVLRTGSPEFYEEIPEELLVMVSRDDERLRILRNLRLKSAVCAPIVARGRTFGAVTLISAESGRRYTRSDLATAEELARRIGLAIDDSRLYQELREANEAKDEFLGLISHELRTPITAIYGGARVLRLRGNRLDEGNREHMIADIEQESERLFRMVENLLALARVELGQKAATEPVLAQRVIDKVVTSFSQRKPGRRLEVRVDPDLQPLWAEPVYLEQVLRNLLGNADKYSGPDAPIDIVAVPRDGLVDISVLDRGPGISPEEVDLIFERFYRSQRTSSRASGIGMGLTVCKRLVEAQSGKIWARPREGSGLEVGFTLPLYDGGEETT